LTAFVQGQVGGRAVAPREGDDPDAVLSRVQAAVSAGDLEAALSRNLRAARGRAGEMAAWIAMQRPAPPSLRRSSSVTAAVTGAN
jgi:hypothetical protein